jgi:TolA-binding protein
MPGGGSVRVSRRAVGLILWLALLCGCSQQAAATEDLIKALGDAHSAIASSILAIELYDQDRSTRAVTETVLGDMAKQIADAESALESVKIGSDQTRSDRDAALAAIQAGVTAVLTSRDELKMHGAVQSTAELESAARQVDSVLADLRGTR